MRKQLAHTISIAFFLMASINVIAQQNVGVGTVSPSFRLDVQGDAASILLTNINSKVNYSGALDIKAFDGTSVTNPGYGIGGRFTGGYKGVEALCQGGSYSTIPLYGVYGSATGTAGTRIGIYGTASGGAANYGVYGYASGGANYIGVFGQNLNLSGYAGYFDGRGLFKNELRTNADFIADGSIGIGTATPTAKLQILGGVDASLTTNGYAQFGPTSSWNVVIDDNEVMARNNGSANDLLFQQDDGNILMCGMKQGRVGIGVHLASDLPTGYMLVVDGKIIAEELRIQNSTNWPDYVFAEHYPLMSLDDLRRAIDTYKHLPNIPSAETAAQDGILIGDMQKRMMEKIEELTLYVLKLNDVNNLQQKEIEKMKMELQALKEN